MVKQTAKLFKNRRTTQEFLFSQSEEAMEPLASGKKETPCDTGGRTSIREHFPDIMDREALIEAVETRIPDSSAFCVIAVEIESAACDTADPESTPVPGAAAIVDALAPLADLGRRHGGVWGQIAPRRFALAVTDHGPDEAMDLARRLLDSWPEPDTAPLTVGIALYPTLDDGRGQTIENADKALDHAAFFGPGSITAFDAVSLNISGDRHYQAGEIDRAVEDFAKGLRLDPTDVNLHNSLGVCYGVLKDYDSAFRAFDDAIALAPDEVMPVYNKGYLLLLEGKPDEALACFLEAQAKEPDIFEVVFHIGQILMETDDAERARDYLAAALRANPRSGPAHKLMGDCLTATGAIRQAIQAYKNAVKINPEDADSLSALGGLYSRIEESLDVAAVLCRQSVRLAPDNGLFRHRLGEAYMKQAKFDAALAEFESAAAMGYDSRDRIARLRERQDDARAS